MMESVRYAANDADLILLVTDLFGEEIADIAISEK